MFMLTTTTTKNFNQIKFNMNKLYFLFIFVSQSLSSNASLLPLMRVQEIEEFFPGINGNLTKITWDHAVNSMELLSKSLGSDVMMIEADVVLGTISGANKILPIMAHPPKNISDLSLEMFLNLVTDFNQNSTLHQKGVKLDFKTTDAFKNSVEIIEKSYKKMNFPIWLNADILPGPVNSTETPVDPDVFISKSRNFKNATLSLGWRTRYGNGINNGSYSKDNIMDMVSVINNNIQGKEMPIITFPVRAGIAAQSNDELLILLNEVKNSTFTIWGSANDDVNVESLRSLIKHATIKKVYVDVPKSLLDKLRLDELNAGISFKPLAIITAITALIVQLF